MKTTTEGRRFPKETSRSTGETLRLLAAILWDALRGVVAASPAYIAMIGKPGEEAAITTNRHIGIRQP